MDSISFQSYSAQLRFYTGGSGAPKPKPPGSSSDSSNDGSSAAVSSQSKDGDSFTLSIEARSLQVYSDAAGQAGAAPQALAGNDGASPGPDGNAGNGAAQSQAAPQAHGYQRHHHHGRAMGNPQDVADKVLQHLQQEYADKGGSKQDFLDTVQKRLGARTAQPGSSQPDGFRSQVESLISAGITAWAGAADSGAVAGATQPSAASTPGAGPSQAA